MKMDADGLVRSETAVGTPDYISPEILRVRTFSETVDTVFYCEYATLTCLDLKKLLETRCQKFQDQNSIAACSLELAIRGQKFL